MHSVCFLSLILKNCKFALKINDWLKAQSCFSNISIRKNIPKKWFSTQNWPLDVSFQMRLTPNYRSFLFLEKLNWNYGASFHSVLKRWPHGFCLIAPEIRCLLGWDLSHLRPDIQRSVLSTKPFFRDICELRYLKNNSELLVNH